MIHVAKLDGLAGLLEHQQRCKQSNIRPAKCPWLADAK